jgi:hypothetical protein
VNFAVLSSGEKVGELPVPKFTLKSKVRTLTDTTFSRRMAERNTSVGGETASNWAWTSDLAIGALVRENPERIELLI